MKPRSARSPCGSTTPDRLPPLAIGIVKAEANALRKRLLEEPEELLGCGARASANRGARGLADDDTPAERSECARLCGG